MHIKKFTALDKIMFNIYLPVEMSQHKNFTEYTNK